MISHRKGWKNRPGCRDGRIAFVRNFDNTTDKPYTVEQRRVDAAEQAAQVDNNEIQPDDGAVEGSPPFDENLANADKEADQEYERTTNIPIKDPEAEEIARLILQSRERVLNGGGDQLPPLNADEFSIEPPTGGVDTSQDTLTVRLPIMARVIYDWARQKGWLQGDGSLSAFIWDTFASHWLDCAGLIVLIGQREEIGLGTGTGAERK